MGETTRVVPADPQNPGSDVLIGELGTRTHYIHCAMAQAVVPLSPGEIGRRAELIARANGYAVRPTTFFSSTTGSHLRSMQTKPGRGFAEPVQRGLWQLTLRARRLIEASLPSRGSPAPVTRHSGASSPSQLDLPPTPVVSALNSKIDVSAREGRVLLKLHRERERNRHLVAQKKQQVLGNTGRLACEACGFDFATVYGELGDGFAECHHRQPLADTGETRTTLADLAIVCANCHRMLHRRPWRTVDDLRGLLHSRPGSEPRSGGSR